MFKNKKSNKFTWTKVIKVQKQLVKDDVFNDVVSNIYKDPTVIDITWEPYYDIILKNNVNITKYAGMMVTVRYLDIDNT